MTRRTPGILSRIKNISSSKQTYPVSCRCLLISCACLLTVAFGIAPLFAQAVSVNGAVGSGARSAQPTQAYRLKRDYAKAPVAMRIMLPAMNRAKQAVAQHKTNNPPLQIGFGRALPASYRGNLAAQLPWDKQHDGSVVSALSLTSPGAKALRIALRAKLPAGAELRFFSPSNTKQRLPPLTRRDFSLEALWSPVIEGDTLGIEITLPSAAKRTNLSLTIDRVSHLSVSIIQPSHSRDIGEARWCHIDAVCQTTTPINLRSAVAKMVYTRSSGGSFLCTGNLLNDMAASTIPYFITAYHCINTQSEASSLVTYWDFEKSICGGANPSSVTQLTAGADLLAAHAASDSALLRLRRNPPGDNRFYAGWDASTLNHPTDVIGIHHPRGDIKKWSRGRTINNESYTLGGDQRVEYAVQVQWSQGTIENGSSGAGLFDSMGRLRGVTSALRTLQRACRGTQYTSYGRFDQFYSQVRRWLNPAADDPGVTLSQASLDLAEGSSGNYLVILNTQPTSNVTIMIASDNNEVTTSPGALTFASDTWNTAQTVTVNTSQDSDTMDDSATLSHTVSGYDSVTADNVTVTVIDDDHANTRNQATLVALNTMTAGRLHRDDLDYFRLTIPRAATLTVGTSGTTNTFGLLYDAEGIELARHDDIFSLANRNFRIIRDVLAGTYYVAVRGFLGSTTGAYTLHVIVPGVTVDTTRLSFAEGSSGNYTVNLDTQPRGNVMVTIASDNNDLTTSPGALTFTNEDWATAQTVTVTAGQDVDRFDDAGILSHAVSGYGSVTTADNVTVMVSDNYTMMGVSLSQTNLDLTEGSSDNYLVRLNTQPPGNVTVTVNSNNPDVTPNPSALTFITSDWATTQTVMVTAGRDTDTSDGSATLSHTVSGYDPVTTADSVTVTVADAAGVSIIPTRLRLIEGVNGTYTVGLDDRPGDDVTVTIASNNREVPTNPSALTFNSSTWSTAQTVTVNTRQDSDILDGSATLSHTVSGYDSITTADDVMVTVVDDNHGNTRAQATPIPLNMLAFGTLYAGDIDYFRLIIPRAAILTVETSGTTNTFGLLYDAEGIELARNDNGGIFSNFLITRAVTAGTYYVAVRDASSSATGSYFLDVTVPGVTVSTTRLNLDEGSSDSYTINLDTRPEGNVTVTIASNNSDVTTNPSALTFTASYFSWSTAQTVTVNTKQDSDIMDESATLSHTVNGYEEMATADNVTVMVTDNDAPGITADPNTGLTTGEDGTTDTLTVALDTEPTDPVTISLSSNDAGEGMVSPSSLTFATSVWNTAQTVTVTGVDDDVADGNQDYTVTLDPSSGDSDYDGLSSVTVRVTNNDNDTPGVTVDPSTSLTTDETGATATFTVKLNTEPTAVVTVTLMSSAEAEGTVAPDELTFATDAWSTTQTVTVTGVDDDVADGNQSYMITLDPSSGDASYDGLSSVTVRVTNTDDDTAGVTATPNAGLITGEDRTAATFTVELNTEPTAAVTVTLMSSAEAEGTVAPDELTFATGVWSTAQTVTVTGVDDDVADGNQDYMVTLDPSSTDTNYNELASVTVRVTNTDDDTAGVTATPNAGLITGEDRTAATFTVELDTEPTAAVTVTLMSSAEAEGTVAPDELTFATGVWSTAQTVTVTGVDDDVADGNQSYMITLDPSSGDADYAGLSSVTVRVTNNDDDTAGVSVDTDSTMPDNQTTLTVTEGASGTYTVVLDTQPADDVTVTVTSNNADVTVDTDSATGNQKILTFTMGNWAMTQMVTVRAAEDTDALNDTAVLSHTVSGYGRVTTADNVTVTVTDGDDIPETTVDVNGDRYIDAKDAIILFIYTLGDTPQIRTLLRQRLGSDDFDKAMARANAWERSVASGGDLNLDGDVDAQDALIIYYAKQFEDLLQSQAGLRRLLLNELRGNVPATDVGYRQLLRRAQALR